MIYLDSAATAKYTNKDDIVVDTMVTAMKDSWLNPSSLYASNVKNKINKCRANIAKFIGAKPEEIIFTSGASESNNMAIRGWHEYKFYDEGYNHFDKEIFTHCFTTPIEHKSVLSAFYDTPCLSAELIPIDECGSVRLDIFEKYFLHTYEDKRPPILVSVCMANNEIGTIQDIKKISELVHKYNGVLHVDATQAFGHIPIDVEELGIDMMSCSGHKISPVLRGIGFLYKRNGVNIKPLIYGNQENGMRGSTENTYGIIGLSKAIEYCDVSQKHIEDMCNKRDYFVGRLESKFGCKLNGHREHRLPNNINVTFSQNVTGESLLYILDMSRIRISVGSACNSKAIEPSYVLKAIGLSNEEAMRTVRFSLPNDITYEQINYVVDEIEKSIRILEM